MGRSAAADSTSISLAKTSTRLHLPIDADHPFGAHLLRGGKGRRIGVGDDLGQAVMVAQVDEQQTAMVADAMHPAGKADGLTDLGRAEGPASERAIAMHGKLPGRQGNGSKSGPCVGPQTRRKSTWGRAFVKACKGLVADLQQHGRFRP
jgi:hypothetical protein